MSGDPYIKENDELHAEIERLKVELQLSGSAEVRLEAEVARLQELLRGIGANRYWEGRWRDADAENQKLQAALEDIKQNDCAQKSCDVYEIAREALAKGGKCSET